MQPHVEKALTYEHRTEIGITGLDGKHVTVYVCWSHFQFKPHRWGRGIVYCALIGLIWCDRSDAAFCSRSDEWNGEKGEKVSFRRAVAPYHRDIRKQLWAGYNADVAAQRTAGRYVIAASSPVSVAFNSAALKTAINDAHAALNKAIFEMNELFTRLTDIERHRM